MQQARGKHKLKLTNLWSWTNGKKLPLILRMTLMSTGLVSTPILKTGPI